MRHRFNKFICLLLITVLLTASLPPVSNIFASGNSYDGTAADWALPEIQKAEINGLTYPDILKNFNATITREEFCILVVKLYEQLTDKTAVVGINPFTDTSNPEILKAYNLGIVKGTAPDKFSPLNNVTRQEMATFLVRTLKVVYPSVSAEDTNISGFSDTYLLADWARPSMIFCVNNSIFKGVGANLLDPLGNTDRQQAIALIERVYEKFNNWIAPPINQAFDYTTLPNIAAAGMITKPSAAVSISQLDPRTDFAHPAFNTKLSLYASSGQGKPTSAPTAGLLENSLLASRTADSIGFVPVMPSQTLIPSPVIKSITPTLPPIQQKPALKYTDSPYTAFVDSGGDGRHYFYYTLQAPNTAKVVWQVSKYPFKGLADGWKTPSGLVSSGEILPGAKEFYIDFSKFNRLESNNILMPINILGSREIKMDRKTYYVRAVPVDSAGNCIGEPGTGLPIVFGKPQVQSSYQKQTVTPSIELWIAKYTGTTTSPEFPNNFIQDPNLVLSSTPSSGPRYFQLNNFDPTITRFIVQVSTRNYDSTAANWENPNGLVYKKEYMAGKLATFNTYSNAVGIDFAAFSPKEADLGDKGIEYYVRVIGLKPVSTDEGGTVQPLFSNTRKYTYIKPAQTIFYETKNIVVPNYSPDLTFEKYDPIQFQREDWLEWFEIYKKAEHAADMNFIYYDSYNNKYLFPYLYYSGIMFAAMPSNVFGWQNMSESEYVNMVNSILEVGDTIYFTKPAPEQKSWYEELWDLVSSFFTNIWETVSKIVSYASNLYESIKVGIVKYVVAAIPLVPAEWRDELNDALMMLADTALIACGVPPTLPNMDKLMDEGIGYALDVAAQEAGIPTNQLTDEVKDMIKKEVKEGISNDKSAGNAPNPTNSPMLRTASFAMYRPAYMDLKFKNTDPQKISPDGFITVKVEETGWPYWRMYDPVYQKIPQLMPNEEIQVRVWLKERPFKTYDGAWGASDGSSFNVYIDQDAINRYLGNTGIKCKFSITTTYNVPYNNPLEAAKAEGYYKNDQQYIYNYYYSDQGESYSFEGIPANLKLGY